MLDETWSWKSWIPSANTPGCDFPLQNLPFCVVRAAGGDLHLGVGIGDFVLDLHGAAREGLLASLPEPLLQACLSPDLNLLMQCGPEATSLLRRELIAILAEGHATPARAKIDLLLSTRTSAIFEKPVSVPNYTDFYSSIHHAMNVGRLFRPDQPLLPNYKFIPIGYHGRASSLVISGTTIRRPSGQTKHPDADLPTFGPCTQLDYEIEVGAYIGRGNTLGHPISISDANRHIFGLSLINDWSARDIQSWEYQPLGPFLGKSFATTVSPWVVTMEALAPFRVPVPPRPVGDPETLPYLRSSPMATAAIDMHLEVYLSSHAMRAASMPPLRLSAGNLCDLYWSFEQMVTHHASNGCNLLPGDLLACGTVSGMSDGSRGSLLEITRRGATPFELPSGERRHFLEDGDEVILCGFCEAPGLPRIGLGECRGVVVPADGSAS